MRYVLILSSNTQPSASAKQIIGQAISALGKAGCQLLAYSDYCESEPPYVNLAIDMESALDYAALNSLCKTIETQMGREAQHKSQGICIIDIDPVICDDTVVRPDEYRRPYFQLCYRSLCQRQSNG